MSTDAQAQELIARFPGALDQAIADWNVYRAGVNAGLFSEPNRRLVENWFAQFPDLWEGIRPNYEYAGELVSAHKLSVKQKADAFIEKLKADPIRSRALGIPILIVGAIIVAAAFGTAGILWGIGYLNEQRNVSSVIEQVTAGKLPADVLKKALESKPGSIFSDLAGAAKWLLFGGLAILIVPTLLKGGKNAPR